MRLVALTLVIATGMIAAVIVSQPATAGCAEDLTRIQVAAQKASPDVRAAVQGLASIAQARTKAMDSAGCDTATAEALRLLGLASLPPLILSTPVPGLDRQPHPPAPAAAASGSPNASSLPASPGPSAQPQTSSADTPSKGPPAAPANPSSAAKDAAAKDGSGRSDWYVLSSDFIGRHLTSQDNPGDSVGVIKGVIIDSSIGQAVIVLVETGGFLGIGTDLIAVPFPALLFNARWDRPMLQTNAEVLQSGPRVTMDNITALVRDPAWRHQVSEHFGVPLVTPAVTSIAKQLNAKSPAPTSKPGAVPASPAALPPGDAAQGHEYIKQMCAGCHTFDANGGTRVGPNLFGVIGRPVAHVAGFSYSQSLKKHGGEWNAATLDAFLQSPQHFASGTMMAFPGIPSSADRANVIAYLKATGTTQGAQK